MSLETILQVHFGVSGIDLEKAKAYQAKHGGRLEKILVNIGSISQEQLVDIYAHLLGAQILSEEDLEHQQSQTDLPESLVSQFIDLGWVPHSKEHEQYRFVTNDPLCWEANQLALLKGITAKPLLARKAVVDALAASIKSQQTDSSTDSVLSELEEDKLRELATEAPTVNLLNGLIAKGVSLGASDMHIEPEKGKFRVRYRVDGVLKKESYLPATLQMAVLSRIKILANMDIAEKRRPQDGKIETKISNTELDIRVSSLPLSQGESIVMRFLKKDAITYDMNVLGITPDLRARIEEDLQTTAGVILLTGPTGSGKTTSLYTFLHELNREEVKIITLEDPVEYQLPGINQVQVNAEIGFDFAAGLRSIVRQDPDIIMLGEIRDKITAQIAMQSALTGHLVFSTVHTNDAPSAYTRLIDLGVEEFLLNAAIVSVIAQRLVRKVCSHCSEPVALEALPLADRVRAIIEDFQVESPNLVAARGCEECGHTGYKGRLAILEYMRCDDDIRNLNKDDYFIPKAREINKKQGGRTLMEDGLLKALRGETTVEEVLRVCA
ncbi:Type II secretion system protein [Saliniradius amylolyticus]|uniref:Type II secretion system protein n=1 Tax=Saliniradius amylolyticus TaxID=2183582 RepID=A0A2S2E0M6_9ALTE|nr:GspE/PulE family protein [Saliniradius amylolyticus]AWL11205.1 Type II secretion system protein [Saliniradius amylolyticus]